MATGAFDISGLGDHLFRKEAGKMVAILTKIFGTENLQLSEDVVQETFATALRTWSLKGVPHNPSAWLFRAARNKAIDVLRRNKFSRSMDFSEGDKALLASEYTLCSIVDRLWEGNPVEDDLLRMMFACCHPEISEENQITLILKTLCAFSTAEIAKALLCSEETISKRLYRTKEFFRERKIRPAFPPVDQLGAKTASVLKAIYLIFNEGYNSTQTEKLIRKDLLEQAMSLCELLCISPYTQLPEVFAAMALMCFHAARTDSRTDEYGEIVLLPQQDRSLWIQSLIKKGSDYLAKAASGTEISTYHMEAAIAFEHCIAPSFEQTNWEHILSFYDMLAVYHPTSVVLLNRLTVIFKVYGAQKTLQEIDSAPCRREWEKNYLYHSLLGDIYSPTDPVLARSAYEKAMTLTKSGAEKKLLSRKLSAL